jgi:excisionase family DNA binding protein
VTNQGACGADIDEADDTLMTGGQVAALFLVHTKTVHRWGDRGLLTVLRTPGRHRRYRRSEVEALRRSVDEAAAAAAAAEGA